MIDTRIQWLKELERISSLVTAYNLSSTLKDATYVVRATGQSPMFHDNDAFNVANSTPHNELVAEAVSAMRSPLPDSEGV